MSKREVVSVVIPVYKVENYLERCINSVLNQTYSELEIILVDDGSPDRCPQICDRYAEMDSRIKVIHKANGGVSSARNAGIGAATGAYIAFVDSDDWIEPDMYQKMVGVAEKMDCDVVICDCFRETIDSIEIRSHDIRPGFYSYDDLRNEYYPHLLMMENIEFPASISNCLCLFRRVERLSESIYHYPDGIKYSEDLLFGAKMMYSARSFYYMKGEALYHYQVYENSASHKYDVNAWDDHVRLCKATSEYFLNQDESLFFSQINLMWLYFIYNTVGETLCEKTLTKRERLLTIKKILSSTEAQNVFKEIRICDLKINWKLKARTFMYKHRIGLSLLIK